MARKKTATVSTQKGVVVVSAPAASAPVRRRRSSGAITRRSKGGGIRRRRSGGGGNSDSSYKSQLIGTGIGGFAFGYLMKHYGNQIPSLPMVGKSGTIAIAAYFFRGKHPIVKDVGVAAAAIAGYSFGKTGTVEGSYDPDLDE